MNRHGQYQIRVASEYCNVSAGLQNSHVTESEKKRLKGTSKGIKFSFRLLKGRGYLAGATENTDTRTRVGMRSFHSPLEGGISYIGRDEVT
jgi:hypothetical protein